MKYLLFLVLIIVGCESKKVTPVEVTGAKDNFEVVKLFTHDGCTVYRFYDSRYRYFTNCSGKTMTEYTETCGKNCTSTIPDDIGGK